ncbi:MAG: VacB/RNase II family 3'-5' exoribonuclease [Planctomycetes bacterium]|nr:VacB/RNase II family 3'-5' exoribonuclease [Planctomycetota bacterium]
MQDLTAQILDFFAQPGVKSIRPKELSYELGLGKRDFAALKATLEQLLESGSLSIGKNKLLRLKGNVGLLVGTIKRTSSGSGYFRPSDPTVLDVDESLYIAPEDLKDAFTGDQVQVQLLKRRMRGKRCGRVIEVLQRASTTFVGNYFEKRNHGFVRIEGGQFESAISVGDPGAKGARPDDQVVVEILRFPGPTDAGEAVITRVLGPRGTPGVDLLTIIHEFGLPDQFPEGVLAEARLQAQQFAGEVADDRASPAGDGSGEAQTPVATPILLRDRVDLTQDTIITIDPIDARDFDDAISLTREPDGNWRLGVHIADVAHFVRPGTLLDKEARHRGTSVYLPDKVLPMLPEVISNALASLQQGRVRFTKSAFITFSPEGTPLHSEFANSAIRVTQRFAYEQVMPLLNASVSNDKASDDVETDSAPLLDVTQPVLELLQRMQALARILRKRRFARGALDLDLPEVKIDMEADGKVTGAHIVSHDESHQIIEEFMLAANIAVATKLADCGLDFLRRTHAPPDERKLTALSEFVGSLGHKIRAMPGRGDLQKLLKEVHGTAHEYSVSYAVLRSTKRAEYSPDPDVGHYALSEANYCHFTSPIRRYPDLTVHRLLDEVIRAGQEGHVRKKKRKPEKPGRHGDSSESSLPADLVSLGKWCSQTERRADDAEKELIKLKMLEYLADRIGEEMDATITGVEKFGIFCQGIQLPAEGLVHISLLPDDQYDYDDRSHTLVGRRRGRVFRLGGTVRVVVKEVDLVNRNLELALVADGKKSDEPKPDRRDFAPDRPRKGPKKHGKEGKRRKR